MTPEDFRESRSRTLHVEFLGYEVDVEAEVADSELDRLADVIENVVRWNEAFFGKLEGMLLDYCRTTLRNCGETEPVVRTSDELWRNVRIGSLVLLRHDGASFVMASGRCEWEIEHGLEFDVDATDRVLYVGPFIGNGFHEDPDEPNPMNFASSGR